MDSPVSIQADLNDCDDVIHSARDWTRGPSSRVDPVSGSSLDNEAVVGPVRQASFEQLDRPSSPPLDAVLPGTSHSCIGHAVTIPALVLSLPATGGRVLSALKSSLVPG